MGLWILAYLDFLLSCLFFYLVYLMDAESIPETSNNVMSMQIRLRLH